MQLAVMHKLPLECFVIGGDVGMAQMSPMSASPKGVDVGNGVRFVACLDGSVSVVLVIPPVGIDERTANVSDKHACVPALLGQVDKLLSNLLRPYIRIVNVMRHFRHDT